MRLASLWSVSVLLLLAGCATPSDSSCGAVIGTSVEPITPTQRANLESETGTVMAQCQTICWASDAGVAPAGSPVQCAVSPAGDTVTCTYHRLPCR